MEVFLVSGDYERLGSLGQMRLRLHAAAALAWEGLEGMQVVQIRASHAERFSACEAASRGEIYSIADDDCLPSPKVRPEHIHGIFERHPEFGVLAMRNLLNPQFGWGMSEDGEIVECHSVGGIRFLRKGLLGSGTNVSSGDDTEHATAIRPWRSAYLKHYPMIHMGEWYSVWQRRE